MLGGDRLLANRLKILLAERDLSIKDVVSATKISRSAVSNIVNNPFANISTENVDKLCNYLEIAPRDFYDYFPWHFSIGYTPRKRFLKLKGTVLTPVGGLLVHGKSGLNEIDTGFNIELKVNEKDSVNDIELVINMANNELFQSLYEKMSPLFKHVVSDTIKEVMVDFLSKLNSEYELAKLLEKSQFSVSLTLDGNYDTDSFKSLESGHLFNVSFLYDSNNGIVINK